MNTIRVEMKPASQYRTENYGVLLESVTEHSATGPKIHNRHHPHTFEVWENRVSKFHGEVVDPFGKPTDKPYSFLTNPRATVISAHKQEMAPQGPSFAIGDTVVLHVNGFDIGTFEVKANFLHNPHLEPVEVVSV